jgi:hypothetical protein
MFEQYGPIIPWTVEIALIAAAIALIVLFFNRLVPLKTKIEAGNFVKYKSGTLYRF